MKSGGGSQKGSAFERAVCKQLSLWWTADEDSPRDNIFWRSPGSGAMATQRQKSGKNIDLIEGDVSLIDPIGEPFLQACVIEIKRGYSAGKSSRFDVLSIVDAKPTSRGILLRFWIKLSELAYEVNKQPMLIFHRDRRCSCVCCRPALISLLRDHSGAYRGSGIKVKSEMPDKHWFIIMSLEGFLDWANPVSFR